MKEDYCGYNLSKLAKKAGFNWPVTNFYFTKDADTFLNIRMGELISEHPSNNFNRTNKRISAPTHCYLTKWLREEHGIHVGVSFNPAGTYECNLWNPDVEDIDLVEGITYYFHKVGINSQSHYDAFEAGLTEALKLVLKKKVKI